MELDATAVANYFISLSIRDKRPIDLLGLIKRVYIAHGFSLAIYGKPLLNDRFDRVEAWKYGPVIPSIYHSFKQYKSEPIKEPSSIARWSDKDDNLEFCTPELKDDVAQRVCDMVWARYEKYSGLELVKLTHAAGTPWSVVYIEGANCPIPDEYTKLFYKQVIKQELGIEV